MRDINKFLTEMKASSNADVAARWAKVEEHYNKKLWHQLTVQLQAIIKEPSMQDKLIPIYQEFIVDFEARLDPLSLAFIGTVVLERFTSSEEAIVFVEKIGEKVKMHNEAYAMTKVLVGRIKLHKYEQHKETKVLVQKTKNGN
jgi:26S proteasome regulatory subunit N9